MKFNHFILYCIAIGFLLSLGSCDAINNSFQTKKQSNNPIRPIASVNGKMLDIDELLEEVPSSSSKKDSTVIADSYLENWILEQLMYDEAKSRHDQKDKIEQLVERYRRALYVHQLEEKIIEPSKNVKISLEEINNFYLEFKSQDLLVEDIYKLKILILPADTRDLNKFERGWNKDDQTVIDQYKPSTIFIQLDTSKWYSASDILNILPSEFSVTKLKPKGLVKSKINDQRIYLHIYKKIKRGEEAPLVFIYKKIEKILRYQRQREILKRYKEDLYSQALSNKKIEIFNN